MTRSQIRLAIEARLQLAYVAALTVDSTLELQLGGANRRTWTVDAEKQYLRGYYRRAGAARLSAGDHSLERTRGLIIVQLLITKETGEAKADSIAEAIRPVFFSGPDGLRFEDAPQDKGGRDDGSHWLDVTEYPFYVDAVRTVS